MKRVRRCRRCWPGISLQPCPRRRRHQRSARRSAAPAVEHDATPTRKPRSRPASTPPPSPGTTSSDYTTAVDTGAQDEFARLGIEVTAVTDAGFDAAKQKSDVETIMAKKPSIILSLPVDPDTAAEVYRPALEGGAKVAFVDNAPKGYAQGKDYVTIVSDDLFQMGDKAADAMAAAIGGKGKVGYLFHDANFYVTNQRDSAFKETINKIPRYPDRRRSRASPIRPTPRKSSTPSSPRTRTSTASTSPGRSRPIVLAALRNSGQHPYQDRHARPVGAARPSTWSRAAMCGHRRRRGL